MNLNHLVPGARVHVPLTASATYTRPQDLLVQHVTATPNPDVVRLRGRPLEPRTGRPTAGTSARALRVRWRDVSLVDSGAGPLCSSPDCWGTAAAVAHGDPPAPVCLYCPPVGGAAAAQEISRMRHAWRVESDGAYTAASCPCGWHVLTGADEYDLAASLAASHPRTVFGVPTPARTRFLPAQPCTEQPHRP